MGIIHLLQISMAKIFWIAKITNCTPHGIQRNFVLHQDDKISKVEGKLYYPEMLP
jgi:hypothetical protein